MKRNMKKWLDDMTKASVKKALPVLSFPAVQLMDVTVRELISSSDLQAAGIKKVSERIDSAASVSLMDLSLEAECFGAEIVVFDDEVPTVSGSIVATKEEAEALTVPAAGAGRTQIYIDAIGKALDLIKDRPVLAGVIGPFSLAGRIMDVTETMIYCFDEPDMVHTVLKKTTQFLIAYMNEYKKTGANGVLLAEPLAGLLSPPLSSEFSCKYVKQIVDAVQDDDFIIIYHNCGNNTLFMIDEIVKTGASAFHFGDAVNMPDMLERIPAEIAVMGNISPSKEFMNGSVESIRNATLTLMEEVCGKYPNFIISSGCDIPPMSKWENIDSFMNAVHDYYNK